MRGFGLLLLPLVAKLASAQYTIDPDSVPQSTRDTWCSNQQSACPLICLQTAANSSDTIENDCDPDTLSYSCVCADNITPNASEYSQTLPYYICTEWGTQCVSNCSGNTDCEYNCRANHPCGAQDPKRVNITTSSSATASKTASSTNGGAATNSAGQTVYAGLGGSAATTTASSKTGSAAALQLGQSYGLFVVAAGIFGGFAVLL